MKTARKYLAIALAFLLSVLSVPANANESAVPTRLVRDEVVIDDDPEGGYEGDYVVIYNPGDSAFLSTGTLADKIIHSVNTYTPANCCEPELPGITECCATDSFVTEEDREFFEKGLLNAEPARTDYPVGSTKTWIMGNHNPDGNGADIEFKVLYIGEHCRIWTPVDGGPNDNYYPLDEIDGSYAELIAASFDLKYDLMTSRFGNFSDLNGDGKVNLLFHKIKDNSIAGYFSGSDLTKNKLPAVHIDTWKNFLASGAPGMGFVYTVTEHEFQHLISYSNTGGMIPWLDESLANAAEAICSSKRIASRIYEWTGYYYEGGNMPEAEYNQYSSQHNGKSIVYWQTENQCYALGMLFAQFLYTRSGSVDIYKTLIENYNTSGDSSGAKFVASKLGLSAYEMWTEFIKCVTVNSPSAGYGFAVPDYYDPAENNGVEDPFSRLCPVVYTGRSAKTISSYGGFITVKPVGGVYVPPSDASASLKYFGIKIVFPEPDGDADGNGTVEAADALLILRYYMSLLDNGVNVEACDVNGDGKVDAIDALIVLRKAMGIT
ncbi:MAG: dockerin type I repeat-containing protein [Clostridiales bacterium]|nr:dockerin type I repeat-containing protein [Clostridiales bacterium]